MHTGGCCPLNPRRRYMAGRVDRGLWTYRILCTLGGCTPLNPPHGDIWRAGLTGFCKDQLIPQYTPYRLVGCAATAGASKAQPLGVSENAEYGFGATIGKSCELSGQG